MHPYASYIERTAETYYANQRHESYCETLRPYRQPTDSSGFVYDVYIEQHCDCWLTENFDNLTLERKFEALRDLSCRFDLHSAACDRYRSEKITYRNKPEILTFPCNCWLSVDIQSFDPVDSSTMTTETNSSALETAQSLVRTLNASRKEVENYLAPFREQYAAFILEVNPGLYSEKDREASTFKGIDENHFVFEGEEYYEYGDYQTPYIEIPFAFVEDPEAYSEKERKRLAGLAAQFAQSQRETAQRRIDSLRRQLDAAENQMKSLPVDNAPEKD